MAELHQRHSITSVLPTFDRQQHDLELFWELDGQEMTARVSLCTS